MDNDELIKVVRENERMRTALEGIKDYAGSALMGVWRQKVYDMANRGLALSHVASER